MREIRVLGPVEVLDHGSVVSVGGPRQQAALVALALRADERCSLEQLVDALWGERPPSSAVKTARAYVSRLNAALGRGVVTSESGGYRLDASVVTVDAVRFEELVEGAKAALADDAPLLAERTVGDALALWRGASVGEGARLEGFAAEARRLADLRLVAEELMLDAWLALGRLDRVIDRAERLVADHPLREGVWERLMVALYGAGRQADALAAFTQARHALVEELGLEPGPALRSVQARILRAELELPGADELYGNLPAPLTSFIGRVSELARLAELIAESRLVTLVGVGGAGKTRLAIEASMRWRSDLGAPARFVDLAPLRDPDLVPAALLGAIGAAEMPGVDPLTVFADRLGARRALVVLDNCEHLVDSCAHAAVALLGACPRLSLLVTSRSPLGVAGEAVYVVPALAVPDASSPGWRSELAAGFDAVQLFLDRAGAARGDAKPTELDLGLVSAVCEDLDGLPLAIEFAAARTRSMTLTEIASAMNDRFALLGDGRRGGPDRHRTLRASISWSHDLLDAEEQVLLRRVSVFDGGFTAEATAAVCGSDIADGLDQLLDASLITAQPIGEDTRYRLYETVREYAAEQLTDDDERAQLRERHARYFFGLAQRAGQELDGPIEQVWLSRLNAEQDNLRAALKTLLARAPVDALRLSVALSPFWLRWIELEEGRRWFADALAAFPDRGGFRAQALLAVAAICTRAGRNSLAVEYALESVAIARERGGAVLELRAAHFLGAHSVDCEPSAAIPWFERAIEIAHREGLAAAEALCICGLGAAHCWGQLSPRDLGRAERLVTQGVERLEVLAGSQERIATPLNIGEIRATTVAGLSARLVFEDTVMSFVEVSVPQAAAHATVNLASIARMRGELERARNLLEDAGERFRGLNDKRGEADVAVRLAYLELAEGSHQAARSSLELALELRARRSDRRGIGMALSGLGLADAMAGNTEPAERQLADACELFRRAGDRWGLAAALWNTADLKLVHGELDAAESALREARGITDEAGSVRWTAQATVRLGETALLRGNTRRAATLLAEGRDLYASARDEVGAGDVTARLQELTTSRSEDRVTTARSQ